MKILIELPTWIGDSAMATPAIENLLNYYERPEVTMIGSTASIELLRDNPRVQMAIVLNKSYKSLLKMSQSLGKFDVFFSFRSSVRSKFLKILIKSSNKFQFNSKKYRNIHLVEKYNEFINDSLNTQFKAGELNLNIARKINNANNSVKLVGINPGASYGDSKRWYPKEFAKVSIELSKHYDILIFGSNDEKNMACDIEKLLIENGINNYRNLAGETTLLDLTSLISSLDLFITGDSGPMHLAANFKIPTVSIFGPTRVKETSQWMNKKSIILKKNLDCQPCMKRKCPLKHHNCMRLITAEDVLEATKELQIIGKI